MKISDVIDRYRESIAKLEGGIYEFDLILSEVCGISRFSSFIFQDIEISKRDLKKIDYIVDKRIHNTPLSWLIKKHRFMDLDIFIESGVFVPRPETEYLAQMALERSFFLKDPVIMDFCAGSGAIGLYVAHKNRNARVFGVDRSKKAFSVMKKNKEILGLDNFMPVLSSKIDFSDLKFDIVVSNPPYIPKYMYEKLPAVVKREPKSSLLSGQDGLTMIKYIARNLSKVIKPYGVFIGEMGEYYTNKVLSIFGKVSGDVKIIKDVNGKDRYVEVIFNGVFYN